MQCRFLALAVPSLAISSLFVLPLAAPQNSTSASTAIAASAPTPVPALIPYSGLALDAQGRPLADSAAMTFLIYKDEQGGQPLFAETQSVAVDATGHYKVQLGASLSSGIPIDLFSSGEARWIEVQIAGQPSSPRVRLVSVPYALKAADSATLGGLPASAFALAGGKNAVAATSGVSPDGATNVTTTGGVAGYLPEFSGAATIVDSPIFVTTAGNVGVGTTTPGENFVVEGTTKLVGTTKLDGATTAAAAILLQSAAVATAKAGVSSHQLQLQASAFNKTAGVASAQTFAWQALPVNNDTATASGVLDLLFATGTNTLAPTGLSVASNGVVSFVAGQTFPGTGPGTITGVTASSPLTGGGTSGSIALGLNTAALETTLNKTYAQLNAFNTFNSALYAKGGLSIPLGVGTATPSYDLEVYGGSASVAQLALVSNSTDAAISVNNTNTANGGREYWIDSGSSGAGIGEGNFAIYDATASAPRLAIDASGEVTVGPALPGSVLGQFFVQAAGKDDAIYSVGTYVAGSPGSGSSGMISIGASTDNSVGSGAGFGGFFQGGDADTTNDAGYGIDVYGGYGTNNDEEADSAFFDTAIYVNGTTVDVASVSQIDHPLDPANKYLNHASVQSSEMMNIYSGNITSDELGLATVKLPDWFEAENGDFRYQLTVLDERFAQAVVSKKIKNGQFTIHTNASNVEVSWQITAVRQDAYAKAHPMTVEEAKPAHEVGFYHHPELYGQPREKGTEWGRHPKMMQRMEAQRNAMKANQAKGKQVASAIPPTIKAN